MFCLASRYETQPQRIGEVVRIFQQQALPLVSRQPGFKGVCLLTKKTGEFMVLNIWETEAQATAWPVNPEHQKVAGQLKPLLAGAPQRDGYEVAAYTVAR